MKVKDKIVKICKGFGLDPQKITAQIRALRGIDVAYDVNRKLHKKRCLIVYLLSPFQNSIIDDRHQNFRQSLEMARMFDKYGYTVDVINFDNRYARLKYQYDCVCGLIPRGIDVYSKKLKKDAIKIAYLTSMNLEVTAQNEVRRCKELEERRGIVVKPRRNGGKIQKEIENFDAVWCIGNDYNFQSYKTFKMPPVFYIKNSGYVFDWANPQAVRDPKSFVYFGSAGQVHKGLDLLLEIFAYRIKDCKLYVCGCYEKESDFHEAYHKELYETNNIIPMGFVNIESETYKKLATDCAYTILPSCAEARAGSILSNMSAGLIPIVSYACGYEEEYAINLPDCKMDTIEKYIREYSQKDQEWINMMSARSIEIVKHHFSIESFIDSIDKGIKGAIEAHNRKK